jgi:hypothetical protein
MSEINSVRVIIAHYNEDLSWVNNLKYPFWIISKHSLPLETIPNKGNEVSSYLEYIIKNYENLTDVSIFIHGHRSSWHNVDVDVFINNEELYNNDYYNINLICSPRNGESLWALSEEAVGYLEKNKHIIEKEINKTINPLEIKYRPCACFYVKKQTILKYSLQSYKNWYEWIMTTKEPSSISSRVFEYCWHIIFTGNHIDIY